MTYAQRTHVGVDQTKTEIERTLMRYGASRFAYYTESCRASIVFEAHDRRLRFDLPLPSGDSEKEKQLCRARWRALLLCVKAKLESVESKIETFEEAFLAHIVLPDGATVGSHAIPAIAASYKGEKLVPLLPGPSA